MKTLALISVICCASLCYSAETEILGLDSSDARPQQHLNAIPAQGKTDSAAKNITITIGSGNETIGQGAKTKVAAIDSAYFMNTYHIAKRGFITYFVGLGLELCLADPLSIVGALNRNQGTALTGSLIGVVATGLEIAGPIRCGIGGSMAYDHARFIGMSEKTPVHWTFYRVGWVLTVLGEIASLAGTFSGSQQTAVSMSLVSTSLGIAADAMWISSCCTALHYTKQVKADAGLSGVEFGMKPYCSAVNRSTGLLVSCVLY
jgi:hypothetical protein